MHLFYDGVRLLSSVPQKTARLVEEMRLMLPGALTADAILDKAGLRWVTIQTNLIESRERELWCTKQ